MSAIDRQNRLLVAEDWKKIYQSFRNADFQSYDFENLRRTMIDYIRQNYPEDFNDYIESSEYLALIDLIAFLGQSVAFRVDLNARENFLELAERRDSVLRLARLISYNAKRNVAAQGLLKFSTVQTSQSVIDSTGRNLAGQVITWNDASNSNWYDQFIKVINAALNTSQQFGSPVDKATIYGIPTEQYRFESANSGVPVYAFSKTISGRNTTFEITSTSFNGQNFIYEEPPKAGNKLACIFKNDGRGYSSAATGFFLNFTQGNLSTGSFTISQPSTSELVDIQSQGINNNDVWLYRLDKNSAESELWTKVPNFEGNNIIYNSLNKNIRNIYGVTTRAGDAVSLTFSDGTFGNLPLGTFRVYYRISNGLNYKITPQDIRNVSISIPYMSATKQLETLTVTLALATSVSNADTTESNDSIKANAPATYYTQNRMITGEDYNISPLGVNQQILKVKAVNRSSSGISRYFDLVDPTGKYSSTNLFADDGVLYTESYQSFVKFSFANKTDIEVVIYNTVIDILKKIELRNFYYSKFINLITLSLDVFWTTVTTDSSSSSGFISNQSDLQINKVSSFTATDLKYFSPGALVRFSAPEGKYFNTNNKNALVTGTGTEPGYVTYLWAEVVTVASDGTASNTGILPSGMGAITLSTPIPTTSIVSQIIPKFSTSLSQSVISTMIDLIFSNKPFGLRYSAVVQEWQIIFEVNLNSKGAFNLGKQGDISNTQQDSSWVLLFTTDNESYKITSRETRFVFESDKQLRFYFDSSKKIYDTRSNSLIKDSIKILNINPAAGSALPFLVDYKWEIHSEYVGLDGYVDNKKIVVSFADSDDDGIVDNPELFLTIVDPTNSTIALKNRYIVEEKYSISLGQDDFRYINNVNEIVKIYNSESELDTLLDFTIGQYFYFADTAVVKQLTAARKLVPSLMYKVYQGRDNLKFQYIHSADYESRIDPGTSNIIDVFVLTKNYDTAFRQWLAGAAIDKPLALGTDELYNTLAPSLNLIKAVSDEVVYHPVQYKVLFGPTAPLELQAVFKITKTPGRVISDNDIKSQVITAINEFFALENWDFGDTFYFSELATYVMNKTSPNISNFLIVPRQPNLSFGSLFEIKSTSNQIFINGATVTDIEIISGITANQIKSANIITAENSAEQQLITSSSYGSI